MIMVVNCSSLDLVVKFVLTEHTAAVLASSKSGYEFGRNRISLKVPDFGRAGAGPESSIHL